MMYYVKVVGNGESVVELFDTQREMHEAFEKACDLIEEGTYSNGECGEYEDNEYTAFDWVDASDFDYEEDVDECGFDPYEGCYTYDC